LSKIKVLTLEADHISVVLGGYTQTLLLVNPKPGTKTPKVGTVITDKVELKDHGDDVYEYARGTMVVLRSNRSRYEDGGPVRETMHVTLGGTW